MLNIVVARSPKGVQFLCFPRIRIHGCWTLYEMTIEYGEKLYEVLTRVDGSL